jgi:20S proteasome alpha/beta subunit
LNNKIAIGLAGSLGDAQQVIRLLKQQKYNYMKLKEKNK